MPFNARKVLIDAVIQRLVDTETSANVIDELVEAALWVIYDSKKSYSVKYYYEGLGNKGIARLLNDITKGFNTFMETAAASSKYLNGK